MQQLVHARRASSETVSRIQGSAATASPGGWRWVVVVVVVVVVAADH